MLKIEPKGGFFIIITLSLHRNKKGFDISIKLLMFYLNACNFSPLAEIVLFSSRQKETFLVPFKALHVQFSLFLPHQWLYYHLQLDCYFIQESPYLHFLIKIIWKIRPMCHQLIKFILIISVFCYRL